jgi:hypothetical protein
MSVPTVNGVVPDLVTLTAEKLVINGLTITDPEVVRAIHDWGRSHPVGPHVALTELPAHVARLIALGARVEESARSSLAAELMGTAARTASDTMTNSAARIRAEMADTVAEFTSSVTAHLNTLLAGDTSAVADSIRSTMTQQSEAMAASMIGRIDAALTAAVDARLSGTVDRLHSRLDDVGRMVGDMRDRVIADDASIAATAAVIDKSAVLKGSGFENRLNEVLDELAVACSAEYLPTGQTPGDLPQGSGDSLKGDGLWLAEGQSVVIESHNSSARSGHTDGHRDGWSRYLSAAMRNRRAGAALGVVRTAEQNKGQLLRTFGTNSAVVVCDPEVPADVLRLKFMVQVMTLVARHGGQTGTPLVYGQELVVAQRAVADMAERLETLDDLERLALKTPKAATEMHDRVTGLKVGLAAPLDRARETLAVMSSVSTDE